MVFNRADKVSKPKPLSGKTPPGDKIQGLVYKFVFQKLEDFYDTQKEENHKFLSKLTECPRDLIKTLF